MGSCIITSIDSIGAAMEIRKLPTYFMMHETYIVNSIMIHKLRGLRTFHLCSTILRRIEDNNSKVPVPYLRRLFPFSTNDQTLEYLLIRVEGVVSRILDASRCHRFCRVEKKLRKYIVMIESFEEEIDKWYRCLSDYLQHTSSPAVPDQVWDIANSVVENLEDFLSFPRPSYVDQLLVEQIESLKEIVTFLRNFIRFATLLGADQYQEFHDFLTLIQPLAVSAAHVAGHLFSATHYNVMVFFKDSVNSRKIVSFDGMISMITTMLLKISPVHNLHLYDSYTRSLESIKSARGLHVPTHELKDFFALLLSTIWEVLQLDTAPVVFLKDKLQALSEGLRCLRTLLMKRRSKFHGRVRDITRGAIIDAGVLLFSLHRKDFVIDHGLKDFLENLRVIQTEVLGKKVRKTLKFNFPKTNLLGFLDFLLLDYLTEVGSSKVESDTLNCIPKIQEDLVFLRSFMGKLVELRNQQEGLHQALWNLAGEVAYKIEHLIDQLVLGNILDSFSTSLQSITEDMTIIKTGSTKIFYEMTLEISVQEITLTPTDQVPQQSSPPVTDGVVGFQTERSSIIDRLERGSKTLQVVAVVGMPGLGKTTLATKVYNDPSVGYHFHVRTWCSISHVFNRRKVLLELLSRIQPNMNSTKSEDDIDLDALSPWLTKSEDDLAQELRCSLLRRRFLVFIDDVWDIQAFHCLKEAFPDDSTGSRILLTSRQGDLVPEAIFLPQLTPKESLKLLQRKLFPVLKDWPPALQQFGMDVADYCKGLPLTIVIVAGILTTKRQEAWEEIMESLRSGMTSTVTDECKNSIDLSYKHLPDHLKPCFLSFGAFPEDQEVSVKNLIWQWVAEGFVRKSESKCLEEVATDYLNILIGRSLVINAREKSRGGVKACRMHDLIHDFCSSKVKEEQFLHVLEIGQLPLDGIDNLRRLCVYSKAERFKGCKLFCPHLRSLSFFYPTVWEERGLDMTFIFRISKLLRVLAMGQVGLTHVPSEIGFLVQLRYLAIQVEYKVSPSIGNLINLETLILFLTRTRAKLPEAFWNLQKLRHLYSRNRSQGIEFPVNDLDSSCNLVELESLSTLYSENLDIMEKLLTKFPNIRRLKCRLSEFKNDPVNVSKVVPFSILSQLESLSLSSHHMYSTRLILPENIKKLRLKVHGLSWENISTIAYLPQLEALKINHCRFIGNRWHVEEGEFSELKFLKLKYLDIVNWTAASDDQFPNLEKLVLKHCQKLEEIPECLENVATLKMIEVRSCSARAASLVKRVEDCQEDMGNSVLLVHMHDISSEVSSNDEDSWWKVLHKVTVLEKVSSMLRRFFSHLCPFSPVNVQS